MSYTRLSLLILFFLVSLFPFLYFLPFPISSCLHCFHFLVLHFFLRVILSESLPSVLFFISFSILSLSCLISMFVSLFHFYLLFPSVFNPTFLFFSLPVSIFLLSFLLSHFLHITISIFLSFHLSFLPSHSLHITISIFLSFFFSFSSFQFSSFHHFYYISFLLSFLPFHSLHLPPPPAVFTGKVPVLMVDDEPLFNGVAIASYVAKVAGLVPEDNFDATLCLSVVGTIQEITFNSLRIW